MSFSSKCPIDFLNIGQPFNVIIDAATLLIYTLCLYKPNISPMKCVMYVKVFTKDIYVHTSKSGTIFSYLWFNNFDFNMCK